MKLSVGENREILLEEVYSGVLLKTRDGETMGICMRDTGFEFSYQNVWYSAQNGIIKPMKVSERGNILVDQAESGNDCNTGNSNDLTKEN